MTHRGEMISVLINTLNEENNIRNCLESVKWVDEVIIVDMNSSDRTVEIAREYTDKIFQFESVGYSEPARQYGLERASGDWILIVDADEMVPCPLKFKLRELATRNTADVVRFPRLNYYFGEPIDVTGMAPLRDMQIRFFKRGAVFFTPEIHNFTRLAPGVNVHSVTDPALSFIHFNFLDLEHYLEKFNRYTTIEARNMFQGIKMPHRSAWAAVWHSACVFNFHYKKARGYKAGFRGFVLSALMAGYVLIVHLKWLLMKFYNSVDVRASVKSEYQRIAKTILEDYSK